MNAVGHRAISEDTVVPHVRLSSRVTVPPSRVTVRMRQMYLAVRLGRVIKPILLKDVRVVRHVKNGPGRGVRLWLNRMVNLQLELGLWETELNPIYRRYIQQDSLVFDIGAGDGFTSLMYANLGAQVVAFEPDPETLALLDANLCLNPTLASRIQVVKDVYSPAAARSASDPSFIKIDVEGAEVEVLRLIPPASTVVVETHSATLEQECEYVLRERGYRTTIIRNAWWRRLYPEYRPTELNRWLLGVRTSSPLTP
jgi:predicted RNA methylase